MKKLTIFKRIIFALFAVLFSVNLWGQEPKDDPIDLEYCTIEGVNNYYTHTGSEITITPVVKYDENQVVSTSYYSVTYVYNDGDAGVNVVDKGKYTLRIEGDGTHAVNSIKKDFFVNSSNAFPSSQDGSSLHPFIISNEDNWITLAYKVYIGDNTSYYYELGNNVTIGEIDGDGNITRNGLMIGDEIKWFCGDLDGKDHTLTFYYDAPITVSFIAPFFSTSATIHDITINGKIKSSYGSAAGLMYSNYNSTTVQDVTISMNIDASAATNCGGFDICGYNTSFENCIYNGTINAGSNSGGFSGSYYSESVTFNNCIFAPAAGSSIASGNTFGTVDDESTDITSCYYTDKLGTTAQGKIAYKTTVAIPSGEVAKSVTVNGTTVYGKVDVEETGVDDIYNYTGSTISITPAVTFDGNTVSSDNQYTYTISPATVKDAGEYTLTIFGNHEKGYYGSYTKKFYVVEPLSGSGTSEDPYIIASEANWLTFANNVNTYGCSYSGQYLKLTANISVTTMVGTSSHPFSGNFSGRIGNTYGAYTLTFNCGSSYYDATNEEIVAPFRYTDGATITSLIVEGAIHTKVGKEAGLIGVNTFTTERATTLEYIINNMDFYCYEELWDAEGGGYAYDGSNIHFSYCSYEGTISASNYHGGFCGKANSNTTFARCLFDPAGGMYWAENFVYDAQGADINYDGPTSAEDGCYYSLGNNQEESEQGTMVYVNVVPEENIGHKITTFHEKQIYKPVEVVISGVQKRYIYNNGSELLNISSVGVTFDGVNAITNEWCWCSKEITNSSLQVVTSVSDIGTYTLTITAPKTGEESDYKGTVTMLVRVVASSSEGWTGLQAKLSGSDATIDLTENITAGTGDVCLVVEGNRTVTINLNGYTIDRGFYQGNNTWSDPVVGGQVLKVNSGCTVIINGPGIIKGGCNKASSNAEHAENSDGGGIVNRGTLTLNNVTVRDNKCVKVSDNNTSRTARGGGVYSGKNSNLTINGGEITNNSAVGGGGGIFVYQATNFTMNKVTEDNKPNIHGNVSKDKGGGIRVDANNSTATLNDCIINNNTVEFLSELSVSNGGGIHLDGGTLTLNRCVITNNRASKFGGGIYIMGGQLHANNCAINYNMSYDATDRFDGCGGGICLLGGKCYLNGGTISNNSSSVIDGGGIYVNSGTLLSIEGNLNITENWKFISNTGGSTETTNVYLVKSDGKITIDGSIVGSTIGVSKYGNTGVFTTGLNGNGTIANFSSDNSVYSIVEYNNEAQLTEISPVIPPSTATWEINTPVILEQPINNTIQHIVIGANGCLYVNTGGYINGVDIDNTTAHAANKLIINGGQVIPSNSGIPATVKKDINYALPLSQGNWYLISSPLVTLTGENPVVYNPISILNNTNLIVKNANNYPEYDLYRFNEAVDLQWENYRATTHDDFTTLEKGRGYLYRNYNDYTITMTGVINVESSINYVLSYHEQVNEHDNKLTGFNIIGNPYTHNIYKGAAGSAIPNGTLLESKYYVLNLENADPNNEPSGMWQLTDDGTAIPPMTGILVQAKAAGTLVMANSTDGDVAPSSKSAENNNIWFSVANGKYEDRACVEFREGHGLNKIAHFNEEAPMLYVHHGDEDFASADVNPETDVIDLNFEAKTMGRYTLSVKPQGEFGYLHLIDKVEGSDIDLLAEGEYSFIGSPSDSKDRFVVRLSETVTNDNGNVIFAYQSGDDIVVSGEGELRVFDIMGRLVMTQHIDGVEMIRKPSQTGVYIFRLNEVSQKIVVK